MAIGKTFIQILGPNEQFPNNPGFPTIFLQKQVDTTRSVFGFNDGNGNTFSSALVLERGPGIGARLNRIFDVNIISPTTGQILIYNSTLNKWVNSSVGDTSGNLWSAGTGSNSIIANNSTGNGANGQLSVAFGSSHQILQTANSAFLGGGFGNTISGGTTNDLCGVGGFGNRIVSSLGARSAFLGGQNNIAFGSSIQNSIMIGGIQNILTIKSRQHVILGGELNILSGASSIGDSILITSSGSVSTVLAARSVVVGGMNLRSFSANTVYTPNLVINNNLSIASGTNASVGMVTLTAGTATIDNTSVLANSIIRLTTQSLGTVIVPKDVAITSRVVGSSFTITSSDNTDTSVVAWQIIQQF